MQAFYQFTKAAITEALRVMGEPVSIGGNQFTAAFNDLEMEVNRYTYGDDDEVTTEATCLKSALSNAPRINETLIRINDRKTYVITEVQNDVASYRITMRQKDG